MLTPHQKDLRKEVRKSLFKNTSNAEFNQLRRMYRACEWLIKPKRKIYDNDLCDFYMDIVEKYKSLEDSLETDEFKCCRDLYCMSFMNEPARTERLWNCYYTGTESFKTVFDNCEKKMLDRLNLFKNSPIDTWRPTFSLGEYCFILYLQPYLDRDFMIKLIGASDLTLDMYHAIEQGKEDRAKSQEQEKRRNKANADRERRAGYANSKPRKPGSGFTMNVDELRGRIANSKIMETRRIK